MKTRWIVGGASFGSVYGVSNARQANQNEVAEIIELAKESAWFGVDTAPSYGHSEQFLGEAGLEGLAVYTKVPGGTQPETLDNSLEQSLKRLRIGHLEGLTFHNQEEFRQNAVPFSKRLDQLKELGTLVSWGVSVYSPFEIEQILRVASPDYFQVPVNLLDRRFVEPRMLRLIAGTGAKIQARSVFLQGVLASRVEDLPPYFNEWKVSLRAAQKHAEENGTNLMRLSLDFVKRQAAVSEVVIGVQNSSQFRVLAKSASDPVLLDVDFTMGPSQNLSLVDPRLWSKN